MSCLCSRQGEASVGIRGMKLLFDQNLSFMLVSAVRWRKSARSRAESSPQLDRSVNLLQESQMVRCVVRVQMLVWEDEGEMDS